jgi:hypothetical protein
MKTIPKLFLTALALTASAVLAYAQNEQPPAQGEGRQRGGDRGNFNPEEFRQRMAERLKTSLKVTDEEWAVIAPLIEKVQTKQRDAMGSRFGGFGGRGGGDRGGSPGGGSTTSDRPGAAESAALRTALESDSTSPEELKAKLTAVRKVREKNAAELAAARADLQKVVTVRQEAVLVSMGILD